MTAKDIVAELRKLGTEQTKKMWMTHGAQEPCLGVKVEDMKKIQKRVKMDYQLALDLYDTGIADAMYLAGLIADDAKMTRSDERFRHCRRLSRQTAPQACGRYGQRHRRGRRRAGWGVRGSVR